MFYYDKWGYIDTNGILVVEPKFDEANAFSEGFACVRFDDKYGYINRAGIFVIEPQFDKAFDFSEGFATVGMLHYNNNKNNDEDYKNDYYSEAKEGWDMIAGDAGFDVDDYDVDEVRTFLGME